MTTESAATPSMLSPSGELTIFEAAAFKGELVRLLEQPGLVLLDLSGVTRVDTSCVQLILSARQSGRLAVTGITPDVERTMAALGCLHAVRV